jgi:mutator protein MutT
MIGPLQVRKIMKHIDVAIAIIHRSSQVLICQRHTNDSFANLWEFPGGKIEPHETPEQCVEREIQEELGISVKATAPFPVIQHTYPKIAIRLFPFLCQFGGGNPRPLASQCLEWVEAPRLRDYPFPAANDALIDQIIARLGGR